MTTVRMGTVWDRTVDVLQGRTAIVASLAALFIFLPNAVSGVVGAWGQSDPSVAIVARIVALAAFVFLMLGMLAITAVASDPAVDRGRAIDVGVKRLGPAIGIIILIGIVAGLLFLPAVLLIVGAGARMTAAGRLDMTQASGGMVAGGALYALVALIAGLVISAKLAPLLAVIVNERLGLGAVARSWRLTRGSTARLVGVILLYVVVVLVVMGAVSSVTGIVARLLLGAEADIAVGAIVAIAGAAVTAASSVLQTVFYTQFYVAAAGGAGGSAPGAA